MTVNEEWLKLSLMMDVLTSVALLIVCVLLNYLILFYVVGLECWNFTYLLT